MNFLTTLFLFSLLKSIAATVPCGAALNLPPDTRAVLQVPDKQFAFGQHSMSTLQDGQWVRRLQELGSFLDIGFSPSRDRTYLLVAEIVRTGWLRRMKRSYRVFSFLPDGALDLAFGKNGSIAFMASSKSKGDASLSIGDNFLHVLDLQRPGSEAAAGGTWIQTRIPFSGRKTLAGGRVEIPPTANWKWNPVLSTHIVPGAKELFTIAMVAQGNPSFTNLIPMRFNVTLEAGTEKIVVDSSPSVPLDRTKTMGAAIETFEDDTVIWQEWMEKDPALPALETYLAGSEINFWVLQDLNSPAGKKVVFKAITGNRTSMGVFKYY